MRAIIASVALWIAMLAFSGPGGAIEYRCTPDGISQCQALNVAGGDTCFKWTCVAGPPPITAQPSIPGVSSNWSCQQVQQPVNSLCTNKASGACIAAGQCGPTGSCEPVQNGHMTCSAPANQKSYFCQCVYVSKTAKDQCEPFVSPGVPAASGMCTKGAD